jgi:hypothetical protein
MSQALNYLALIRRRTARVYQTDRFFADVDWAFVDEMCTLREPWDLTVHL